VYASVGGQGLDVGIIDAANLGWKFAAVVRGWDGEDILDTHPTERHTAAARYCRTLGPDRPDATRPARRYRGDPVGGPAA